MTLPRLHVVTDGTVLARRDFAFRLAAIAGLGPRVAIHLRDREASGRAFWDAASRWAPVVREGGAMLVVSGRPDVAALLHADAVQLGARDLVPADARRVAPGAAMGRSVHAMDEARAAAAEGADYLVAGTVYETPSHPGRSGSGVVALAAIAALGTPVIAIGGITPERAREMSDASAWGVAVIRAVWDADDSARAAQALLAPWEQAA